MSNIKYYLSTLDQILKYNNPSISPEEISFSNIQNIILHTSSSKSIQEYYLIYSYLHKIIPIRYPKEFYALLSILIKPQKIEPMSILYMYGYRHISNIFILLNGKVTILRQIEETIDLTEEEYLIYLCQLFVNGEYAMLNKTLKLNKGVHEINEYEHFESILKNYQSILEKKLGKKQKINNFGKVEIKKNDKGFTYKYMDRKFKSEYLYKMINICIDKYTKRLINKKTEKIPTFHSHEEYINRISPVIFEYRKSVNNNEYDLFIKNLARLKNKKKEKEKDSSDSDDNENEEEEEDSDSDKNLIYYSNNINLINDDENKNNDFKMKCLIYRYKIQQEVFPGSPNTIFNEFFTKSNSYSATVLTNGGENNIVLGYIHKNFFNLPIIAENLLIDKISNINLIINNPIFNSILSEEFDRVYREYFLYKKIINSMGKMLIHENDELTEKSKVFFLKNGLYEILYTNKPIGYINNVDVVGLDDYIYTDEISKKKKYSFSVKVISQNCEYLYANYNEILKIIKSSEVINRNFIEFTMTKKKIKFNQIVSMNKTKKLIFELKSGKIPQTYKKRNKDESEKRDNLGPSNSSNIINNSMNDSTNSINLNKINSLSNYLSRSNSSQDVVRTQRKFIRQKVHVNKLSDKLKSYLRSSDCFKNKLPLNKQIDRSNSNIFSSNEITKFLSEFSCKHRNEPNDNKKYTFSSLLMNSYNSNSAVTKLSKNKSFNNFKNRNKDLDSRLFSASKCTSNLTCKGIRKEFNLNQRNQKNDKFLVRASSSCGFSNHRKSDSISYIKNKMLSNIKLDINTSRKRINIIDLSKITVNKMLFQTQKKSNYYLKSKRLLYSCSPS